jgi:predicted metal-dependent phosphoesterase TrpH
VTTLRIDLHTHTHASDGSDTPTELVDRAVAEGLDIIALTDHDTTAGWFEAMARAGQTGLGLVPGIELSAQILDPERKAPPLSVHVLGYLVNPDSDLLQQELSTIRRHRDDRLQMMVERLSKDVDITWEEVSAGIHPGATPGRPHIAEVLVAKGIVATVSEAFDHYLAGDGPYHVPHYAPTLLTALATIRQAGGVPVLAHPLSGGRQFALGSATNRTELERVLAELAGEGLAGVEVFHRENAPHLVDALHQAATRVGLIVTGSSDYHGSKKPNRLGEHMTSPDQFARILEQGSGTTAVLPTDSVI